MTMLRFRHARLLAIAFAGLLPLQSASAQPSRAPAAVQGEAASPARPKDCTPQAAVYADPAPKGVKLWVLRQGTMVLPENPLRPLSRDEAVVFEVVVNGRRASAWGPDSHHLRQGGALQALEREASGPIRWADAGEPPAAIRVVAEDGRPLLGPLAFGGCEDAPDAKPVAMPTPKKERPARTRPGRNEAGPAPGGPSSGSHLPQGALDGLSLPRR
ncbi:hypothetical protein [Enterovirga rhinocerotis]|uniref:Uncharacterized protein n=1 Tax=Enterovirga rhinocerotis TaxID=1339210 RepID=A0A4R7C5R2_9HYPH|nr:hypothetical protein [Enterovirga rhinocerotis]TDR93551.1 hypothetical protein EV668_0816 [Enterovirga rhinocerotis]